MKRFILLFTLMTMLLCLSPAVLADQERIVDEAGLLTAQEEEILEASARNIVDAYQMDVVIVVVNSLGNQTAREFADNYYDNNGYGIGSDASGVLFLFSIEYGDWYISTCGEAIYALTDYGIDDLFSDISDDLSNDRYFDAFTLYLHLLPDYFEAYQNGNPIDIGNRGEPEVMDMIQILLISLLIGAVVGGIVLLVLRGMMQTAKAQSAATDYMVNGSYNLHHLRDYFLYSRVSKVRRSESSSGGSRTHRSSSGRSHGGRGGRL